MNGLGTLVSLMFQEPYPGGQKAPRREVSGGAGIPAFSLLCQSSFRLWVGVHQPRISVDQQFAQSDIFGVT